MSVNIFAMPSSSLLLLFSFTFSLTNALPWTGAQQTDVYQEAAWSPAPTAVPDVPSNLFKRSSADVNVCGWIGGKSGSPAVCSVGSSCVRDTIHAFVGCCTTEGPCTAGVYTGCVDKNNAGWTPNSGMENNGIYTCTSDAECYRNTYPGGYYQFGCGKSDWATSVETMYSGQPSDMFLQVVYTGVVFSPLLAKASTTSSGSSSSTSASTSSQTSSSSSSSISSSSMSAPSDSSSQSSSSGTSTVAKASGASSTTATSSTAASFKKTENAGTIAGAVIGGLLGLALIIGFALWCGRRKRNQKGQERAGSFITQHNKGVPPTSGPFQRMRPYGPDDFSGVTPRNGNSVEVTANPNAYASLPSRGTTPPPAQPPVHPGSKPGTFQQQYFATPPTASTPLVSEIDGFAQGYNAAITQDRDTHIHTGDLPSAVSDPSPMLMRGGSGGSDRTRRRSQDWGVTTEALRAQRPSSTTVPVQPAGWIPRGLSMRGASTGEGSPEFGVPPRSPLREAIAASLSAAVAGKRSDDVQRYQLVDEVLGDDVPILHSPGRLRRGRARSGTVDKE